MADSSAKAVGYGAYARVYYDPHTITPQLVPGNTPAHRAVFLSKRLVVLLKATMTQISLVNKFHMLSSITRTLTVGDSHNPRRFRTWACFVNGVVFVARKRRARGDTNLKLTAELFRIR